MLVFDRKQDESFLLYDKSTDNVIGVVMSRRKEGCKLAMTFSRCIGVVRTELSRFRDCSIKEIVELKPGTPMKTLEWDQKLKAEEAEAALERSDAG